MRIFLWFLICFLLCSCQSGFYNGPPSDHFDGKKFYYPGERNIPKNRIADLVNLWIAIFQHPWPRQLPVITYPPISNYTTNTKITFINHSTVLIQSKKVNFLMDPIYSYRASPVQWIGPARVRSPGAKFEELPRIDAVLISHNHYDHMDLATIQKLDKDHHPLFIVPLGNKVFLNRHGIHHVVELDWWQKIKVKKATVTLLPAHHSSQRWLHDYNRTLWGSFGLQVYGKKIYFAGDTGYANHFKLIRNAWGKPDFSFLPIGAYEPRSLLKPEHLNPEEAVKSHLDLGSEESMGIHWGTFQLSAEALDQPLKDLAAARKRHHISENKFFIKQEGKPFDIKNSRLNS